MYRALYRDFRPERFEELIGQDHIVRILQSQLASGSTSHAYLFCGTRGTGKTTTARILAKALNCLGEGERPCCECDSCRAIRDGSFIDVVEIDAASNNGVENIRSLRDNVNYPPVVGKYKVFIIDEVHMLSTGAFNALLKTLEEPPSYVVFILATTEPQKIPATILSRCVRLDFRRVSEQMLVDNMKRICAARGVEAEDSALGLIAVSADGSVRDSLSILEQCIFPGEVLRREDVAQILGTAGEESLIRLTEAVRTGNASEALLLLDRMIASGVDVRLLMKQWLEHFRNLLLVKYVKDPGSMLSMSMENVQRVSAQAADVSTAFMDRAIRELTDTIAGTRWSSRPRVMLEICAVKLCASQESEEAFQLRYDGAQAGRLAPAAIEQTPPAAEMPQPDWPDSFAEPQPVLQESFEPAAAGSFASEPMVSEPAAVGPIPSEPPAAPAPKTAGQTEPDDRIWQQVLDEAASESGIFTRFIEQTHLTRVDGDVFYIRCGNARMEDLLDSRGREVAERLMAQKTGRPMRMAFDTGRGPVKAPADKKKDLSDHREELEKFFGMPVDME